MRHIWMIAMLAALLAAPQANAQAVTTPRTEATLITDVASVSAGKPFWAVLHIKLAEGWHTYWKYPGDSGTIPGLKWTLPSGFKAGEIDYLPPERLRTGPLMDYGYNQDAYYPVQITAPTLLNENATVIVAAKAQWLVCKDICVPEKAELSVMLPVTPGGGNAPLGPDATLIESLLKTRPTDVEAAVTYKVMKEKIAFELPLPQAMAGTTDIQFFPETDGFVKNIAEQKIQINGDKLDITLAQGDDITLTEGIGVLSVFKGSERSNYRLKLFNGGMAKAAPAPKSAAKQVESELMGIESAMLFAFLGGLILNLMPCVLPILSLKVLAVAKKGKSEAGKVRAQGLAYTAGVVLSFMAMAACILALQKLAGQELGWGFQMQSPVFVAFLAVLFFLVGLNLSGAFELPVLFGAVGVGAGESGLGGTFLTGVLAVLVATPCSAPFMAPAIGFALAQSPAIVMAVFAALGVGLAAPFLLFSLFPSLAGLLPKPGAWMLTLRQFLAFPMYLTVVWLLWVLTGEAGADGLGVTLLAMVAAAFVVFLLQRESAILKLLAFVIAIGIAVETPKWVMLLPVNSSHATENFTEKLATLRKEGKAVFVDATADWCITCKVNEKVALSKPEVKAAFTSKNITLLVADWTRGDPQITEYLKSFERSGVPIYVYYPPNGGEPKLLPQILTPQIVLDAIGETH